MTSDGQLPSTPRVSDADVIRDLKLCAAETAWPVFDLAVAVIQRLARELETEKVATRCALDQVRYLRAQLSEIKQQPQ